MPWAYLRPIRHPRILLLDGVQDPGNAGTLIRAARAFGLTGVFALEGTVDPFNPKVVRASAGALAHIPVVRLPWAEVARWLAEEEIPLLVADAGRGGCEGSRPFRPLGPGVGNEGAGARERSHGERFPGPGHSDGSGGGLIECGHGRGHTSFRARPFLGQEGRRN